MDFFPSFIENSNLSLKQQKGFRTKFVSRSALLHSFAYTIYNDVQLDLTSETEVFHMLIGRCHTRNRKRSIKQHLIYFNFRSKFQLDLYNVNQVLNLMHIGQILAVTSFQSSRGFTAAEDLILVRSHHLMSTVSKKDSGSDNFRQVFLKNPANIRIE